MNNIPKLTFRTFSAKVGLPRWQKTNWPLKYFEKIMYKHCKVPQSPFITMPFYA